MAQLVVRNISEDAKVRLKQRAKRHGRSLEAEVRDILEHIPAREVSTPAVAASPGASWINELAEKMRGHATFRTP